MGLCQSKEDVSNPTIESTKEIDQGISVESNGKYLCEIYFDKTDVSF